MPIQKLLCVYEVMKVLHRTAISVLPLFSFCTASLQNFVCDLKRNLFPNDRVSSLNKEHILLVDLASDSTLPCYEKVAELCINLACSL